MVNQAVWAGRARSPTVGGMATTLARHQQARRRPVPWSPHAWRQALYLTGSIPVLLAAPALVAAGFLHPPKWALALGALIVVFLASPVLTAAHRYRLRSTAGIQLPPPQPWTRTGLIGYARAPATWRQLGYHLLAAPLLAAGALAALARALLCPSRAEQLQHRVEHLTQTRTGAVDAADAERRRLERDLHDGTQQRLVALAMNLGLARVQARTAEQAHQALAEAHDDAKAALAELRNLVRGLHAALSGVAARLPIPVRLTVDLPRRPSPTIEAVAYFVVSESLTNITKHAQASQAEVVVQRAGDRLHIIVSDDGAGGADPARGTGLAGLAKRAASVDGTFEIASPPGGPTLITVDLPCAR